MAGMGRRDFAPAVACVRVGRGRAHGARRCRAALSQPRRGPAADHARHPVGRHLDSTAASCGRAPTGRRACVVEAATTDSFRDIVRAVSADALPESDFTAKVLLDRLPAGQDIFYRVRFDDIAAPMIAGEPQVGRFRMAPTRQRDVSFVWSGDTAGGWGIDEVARRHAHLRDHAAQPAGLLRPLRRQHLRRMSARAPSRSFRTARSGATS